ncbi:6-phosphofructokinase [Candidatus Poribacteria bacterium]|jgi:ATP-dependent phosphofructokinase / diphosphate-dependent phosphofructokinase|nr:6-phosphofructokinase [Candidatus Poribacteria bacterium]MBT5536034.1 6-phosphofructokinase [Candidatus Poribacteria bacterium]MBT5711412.1 6-phosphofructokinase [Candidatus Poribacteria bacterium]MBT7807988.1 6-phosphofructokinase [Candidatus Poribacteria bacterium]
MATRRLGVLTGGGDTTALNATLKGIALGGEAAGYEVIGIEAGWAGMLADGSAVGLPSSAIDPDRGGTIIRSSRTNLRRVDGGMDQASARITQLGLDALVAIGGDDTLTVGVSLGEHHQSVPVNFVTKTIDNDVGTNPAGAGDYARSEMRNYFCPGFPTAATWLADAARALRTTAYSHGRILIFEAMGRTAGWLALATAYGHPDFIVLPEWPLDVDALVDAIAARYTDRGNVVVVVAEGAIGPDGRPLAESGDVDAFGHRRLGGCSQWLADQLKSRVAHDGGVSAGNISAVIPSYMQRCGRPTAFDRDRAIELGRAAAAAVAAGENNRVACPVLDGDTLATTTHDVGDVLLRDAGGTIIPRTVDPRLYDADSFSITSAGRDYFEPLLGPVGDDYCDAELTPFTG